MTPDVGYVFIVTSTIAALLFNGVAADTGTAPRVRKVLAVYIFINLAFMAIQAYMAIILS